MGISKRGLTPFLLFSYIFLQACDGCGLQKRMDVGLESETYFWRFIGARWEKQWALPPSDQVRFNRA